MIISLVVAMAKNRVIGFKGDMPWRMPVDLQHFKRVTMGKPIIMGRKTFDSIGKPLPGRRNVVISRQASLSISGCEVFNSLDTALDALSDEPEVMIIGGGNVYQQAMPTVEKLYVTLIDAEPEGDTFFPAWNESEWREISREQCEKDEKNDYSCAFVQLARR